MTSSVAQEQKSAFLIYVSQAEFKGNPEQLKEFIAQNRLIEKWWNYVPLLFVVVTSANTNELKESLLKFIGDSTDFIVAKIDPFQTSGYLNKGAWPAFTADIRATLDAERASRYTFGPAKDS